MSNITTVFSRRIKHSAPGIKRDILEQCFEKQGFEKQGPHSRTPFQRRMPSSLRRIAARLYLGTWWALAATLTTTLAPNVSIGAFELPTNLKEIPFKSLAPIPTHKKTSSLIYNELYYRHYRSLTVDDHLSARVFERYLSHLDPQKYYFLASDIAEFEPYRFALDDALQSSELAPGFTIFNRYQQRLIERLVYALDYIDNELPKATFSGDGLIQVDRKYASWPKDEKALNALWRDRLTNAALTLKLADTPPKEIIETLHKRYRSQLQRILQTKSEDAFEPFINAFAQTYDPHTQYLSPRTSENFNINMSLSLEGIGAVLQKEDEYTKVVRLVSAGPADKSNQLKPADRIVGVGQGNDGDIIDVIGWRIDEVVDLIRGPKDTIVTLRIIPSSAQSDYDTKLIHIRRDLVKLEDQAAKSHVIQVKRAKHTLKIGVIDVPAFYVDFAGEQRGDENYRSTTRDVKALIAQLQAQHIDGLVVDLRNNGGGSLSEANQLLGLFIRQGPTVQIKNNKARIKVLRDQDAAIYYDGPMAVLVNRLSASASEIFAAAIQDYRRGLIIGSQTFGKGTVQALRALDHGQLKITQAKFYRISGDSSQHQGVLPDIEFPNLHDISEIGESALENALPWDSIRSVKHDYYYNIPKIIKPLTQQHNARIQKNADYQYLIKTLAANRKWEDKEWLSLNEKTRQAERQQRRQEQLQLLNEKRKAKGEKPLKAWPDEEVDSQEVLSEFNDDEQDVTQDVLLKEASEVLTDLITQSSPTALTQTGG
ncbi:MAG: carboxy terminal-processing peptidase [Gammaproteobacteria bacterium]